MTENDQKLTKKKKIGADIKSIWSEIINNIGPKPTEQF